MQSVASCCWFFQCLLGCYTFPGPFLGSSHAFLATCTPCTYRQIPGDWASMDSLKIQLLLRGSLHLLKASLVFPDEKKWTSAVSNQCIAQVALVYPNSGRVTPGNSRSDIGCLNTNLKDACVLKDKQKKACSEKVLNLKHHHIQASGYI